MFERFTNRAKKVMQLANQEAQRFNHDYINTEHILLGLIKEGSGVAANVLKNLDVDLRTIQLEVEKLIKSGPNIVTMGKLPQTPRVKKVIKYSMEEARNLKHNYVGTEHILLGLFREVEGVAVQVLMNLGLTLEDTREEVINLTGATEPESHKKERTIMVTTRKKPQSPKRIKVKTAIREKKRRLRIRMFCITHYRDPSKLRDQQEQINTFLEGVNTVEILQSSASASPNTDAGARPTGVVTHITVVYKKKKRPKKKK